jgi:hypothetical protein
MNREQINQFLACIGVQPAPEQNRTGWVISKCPLGPWRHDSGESGPRVFGIRIEAGDSFCKCFSCDWHSKLSSLVIEMKKRRQQWPAGGDMQLGKALELIEQAEDGAELALGGPDIEQVLYGDLAAADGHVFPEDWLASFPPALSMGWSAQYLAGRAVPPVLAQLLDLRADPKRLRVCFPVRDFGGKLRGLHGRTVEKDVEPRYRMYPHGGHTNQLIWLGEHWVDPDRPIVVVEGPFDLASVMRVYRNTVSPLFANPSVEKLHRMADVLEWVTLLDHGKGGDTGRQKIDMVMTQQVITHLVPPEGVKDAGDMTVEQLAQLLSPQLHLDEILLA